ncbi:DUF2292 domain-containing protein [Methylococcus sp. EFPC2]|uniref:YezD family protein n=1 Tax=Methylococcus sp. EFPC2 TaxID=2812648 RepID=UPI0019673796|nr:DUF2292 domain-containing protein [Methylococcus sp. EFPC2]QSA96886.1 YezD family protein [Methylococcus sp. EFPC2]
MSSPTVASISETEARIVSQLLDALRNLRFGSIELTVHDGRVVQIERREKVRLEHNGSSR